MNRFGHGRGAGPPGDASPRFARFSGVSRGHLWVWLAGWLICGLASLAAAQSVETGIIRGRVLDARTGEPLPGVNVLIKDTVLGSSTNLDGVFEVRRVRPGRYTVVASMIGYKVQERSAVVVGPGETVEVTFRLQDSFIELSPVVVTASRKSKSLAETPNSVSVISAADIRRRNSLDIRNALKYAPGVSFIGGQVNIRGTTGFSRGAGSRVLLLTDGVPTMPGDSGDIKWDVVPFTVVEKVEVVKGAASALYGSSAIGGVLNVITKEPADRPEFSVRLTGAAYDVSGFSGHDCVRGRRFSNQQDVYFSNATGRLGYIAAFGRRQSRGFKANSDFLRWNAFAKAVYRFTPETHFTVTGSFASEDRGESLLWQQYLGEPPQPLCVPVGEENNTVSSHKLYLNGTFSQLLNQDFAHKIRVSYFRNRFENDFVDNQDFSVAQRYRTEYQTDFQPGFRHSVTAGVEGTLDRVRGNFFGTRNAFGVGAYLQDEVKLTDRLSVSLGARFDFSDVDSGRTETQLSPKLGLIYALGQRATLKASVGRGFRAPSVAELFTATSASGFQVIPNPGLQAESSWSAEVSVSSTLGDHVLLNLAVYQERYFDFINPGFQLVDLRPMIRFDNVQDARIRGLEANLASAWLDNRFNAAVSYVFVHPRDLETDRLLSYRPQHILTASVTARPGVFELGVDFRFASTLKAEQVEVFPQDPRVPTRIVDARAGVVLRRLTVMLNVENLTQYRYVQVERNLEPVRQFALTVQHDF